MIEDINKLVKAIESLAQRIDLMEQRIGSGGSDKKRTVWELTKIMEAKEKEAQEIKNAHSFDSALGAQWDGDISRDEYCKLRREIRGINQEIASMGPS